MNTAESGKSPVGFLLMIVIVAVVSAVATVAAQRLFSGDVNTAVTGGVVGGVVAAVIASRSSGKRGDGE